MVYVEDEIHNTNPLLSNFYFLRKQGQDYYPLWRNSGNFCIQTILVLSRYTE